MKTTTAASNKAKIVNAPAEMPITAPFDNPDEPSDVATFVVTASVFVFKMAK